MADIQKTTLALEVQKVIRDGNKPVFNRWELQIHANGKTYKPYFIDSVSSFRDYSNHYHEELTVTAVFNTADAVHGIMPYNNKLTATLRKVPIAGAYSAMLSQSSSIKGQQYNAYLYNNKSVLVESNQSGMSHATSAEKLSMTSLEIQLVDKVVEKLRAHTFSTIVKSCTGMDVVATILDSVTRSVAKAEGVTFVGVDPAPGYNTKTVNHIVLPTSTPLIGINNSLPRIANAAQGGIYPQGLAYHYQDNIWYLFPPFSTDRYQKSDKTLTIINVPADKFPGIERTYRTTSTQTVVLSTGDAKHHDMSIQAQANQGNGVRFIDASKVMNNYVSVKDGEATFNGSQNLNEFMVKPRDNGTDMIAGGSNGGITIGYSNEYAKLMSRTGNYVQLTWENANISLIYPGMPVRFMYMIKDLPYEIYGSVASVQSLDRPINADLNNRVFSTNAVVTIYIDKVQDPPTKLSG